MILPKYSFENIVQLLQNSSVFYLVKLNMEGNYVYLNDHFVDRNATYYDHESIKPASTALHPNDYAACYKTFLNCVAFPEQVFPLNLRKLDGKGGYIVSAWEYRASRLPDGRVDGVLGIGYDITTFESHKEYIKQLTSTLNSLADQQSHRVRRPLANILGLVEVLSQQYDENEIQTDIVAMLRQSCQELDQEFDDFLLRNFSEGDIKGS